MTLEDLRAEYARSLLILRHERAMRERVFAGDPSKMRHKVAEIDTVLATLAELGRRLAMQQQADAVQKSLFNEPKGTHEHATQT